MELPENFGRIVRNYELSGLTWMGVGGPADWLFQPAGLTELSQFLKAIPPQTRIFPLGVGSNLIVRDGGIRAVVVRLGRPFGKICIRNGVIHAGAAALDSRLAIKAANAGINLAFLRTIPGTVGGAVRMNAGCYGTYVADVLLQATVVFRNGEIAVLDRDQLGFGYRTVDLPADAIVVEAKFAGPRDCPKRIIDRMERQLASRNSSQPAGDRTAGSIFRNPLGRSSSGDPGESQEGKAWKFVDRAGMRNARRGGARVSDLHANFLVNDGDATAADLEDLAELVRSRVLSSCNVMLEYEIVRVGDRTPPQ